MSRRFGSDKASALLRGRPLLAWVTDALAPVCSKLVVVAAQGQKLPAISPGAPVEVVTDRYERMGPLAGMVTAFSEGLTEHVFLAACDVPLLRTELVAGLLDRAHGYDIVCPKVGEALQPLAAVYRPETCLPVFKRRVESGQRKVIDAFPELHVLYVGDDELEEFDPTLQSFLNANEPAGLAPLEAELSGEVGPRPWRALF